MKLDPGLVQIVARVDSESSLLAEVADWLKSQTDADRCHILLPTGRNALVIRASTTHPDLADRLKMGKGVGLAGAVFESGETLVVSTGLAQHEINKKVTDLEEDEFDSAIATILETSESKIGVAYLTRKSSWPIKKAEQKRIEDAAEQAAQVITIYRAGYSAGSQSDHLGLLSEVSKTLSSSPYLEEILQLLVNTTAQRFNYLVVTVRLLNETRTELILRATQATNRAYQRKRAIKLGESIAGRAIDLQKPIIVEDVQTNPDYIGHDLAEAQGLRSMVCVPLIVQSRPVGVMSCYTGELHHFSSDEIAALETLAKQAALSIEHAKLQVRSSLLQEMHHRVKNNLQQVASLLRLQMRQSHYKSLEHALNDTLGRIQAISSVHELLSRDDLDHVSLLHIAETLVLHQQQSFISPEKKISFSVRGDEVHLNTNQATQVALIINELIQNAVEHGFESATEGEIHITVEDHSDEIALWVSNNGEPVPQGFDPVEGGKLGLQIIRSLSGGLRGSFKIENKLGWTVCEVRFSRQAAE